MTDIMKLAKQVGVFTGGHPMNPLNVSVKELNDFFDAAFNDGIEAAIYVIETHKIPVGNSAAGEMACEWTYAALKEIRDDIRNLKKSNAKTD